MLVSIIALVGAINWGLVGALNFNLVEYLCSSFDNKNVERLIYIIVGICGVLLLINRDTYLPFLGKAAFPLPLKEFTPVAKGEMISKTIKNLPVGAKVIYWAANSSDNVIDNPLEAYGSYENQGVTVVNDKGEALLTVNKPSSYNVPNKGRLLPHIHYRYWIKYENGLLASSIHTVRI
jgi:uncharacterized membrane protein YuzA (DUF378 family)